MREHNAQSLTTTTATKCEEACLRCDVHGILIRKMIYALIENVFSLLLNFHHYDILKTKNNLEITKRGNLAHSTNKSPKICNLLAITGHQDDTEHIWCHKLVLISCQASWGEWCNSFNFPLIHNLQRRLPLLLPVFFSVLYFFLIFCVCALSSSLTASTIN